jgi:4,5-dihydroxyphthalate decarboxylase
VSITFLDHIELADELFQAGKIDAACATGIPIDTTTPNVRRLFPDRGRSFMERFHGSAGFLGCNHTLLMQRRLAEGHPWLPEALYEAFERSKQEAYRRNPKARLVFPDTDPEWQAEVFGSEPYVAGLAANRAMVTMGAEQSLRDGLVQTLPNVDALWCERLRGT